VDAGYRLTGAGPTVCERWEEPLAPSHGRAAAWVGPVRISYSACPDGTSCPRNPRPGVETHGAPCHEPDSLRYLFPRGVRRAPAWQIVVPVVGIAILGYTIDKQVTGQAFRYDRFPFVVAIWLLVGLAIVVAVPGLARRIGVGLAREEGLAADDAAAASGS